MKPALSSQWLIQLALLGGLVWAGVEVSFVNWRTVDAPVDAIPLRLRHDAKGDGGFGAPRSGNRRHGGIDLAAPLESPVRAIRSGWVVTVARHPGRGLYIDLDHGNHLRSRYAHLHGASVEEGARVRQGEVIGAVGKTGNARHRAIVPHVHLEVWRDGERIDPHTLGLRVEESAASHSEVPTHASGGA